MTNRHSKILEILNFVLNSLFFYRSINKDVADVLMQSCGKKINEMNERKKKKRKTGDKMRADER